MTESLSRILSRFIISTDYDNLPPEVIDKMKTSLFHSLVVSILGAETSHGKAAVELAKVEEGKENGATILVDGTKATRSGAAFANSKLMHATNQSDSYRMLIHPGPCIIPAVLAAAELGSSSGKDVLSAMAVAYEVESRLAGDFIPSVQARGFRSSPIFGTLGSAIATGKLLGLDEDQMVTAVALASTFTCGTNEGPRSGGREMMFHEPQATRNGLMAALLAKENVKGSETSLEGDAGFYNAFVGNNKGDLSYVFNGPNTVSLDSIVEGIGERWELMHVVPKLYPTAGYNCPVIELMTDIRAAHDLSIQDVEKITVDMNWLETSYPSPAFPNPSRTAPGVASTHYFAAYTCINGNYPPLRKRIEAGEQSLDGEDAVLDLLKKVDVIGHKDRRAFAPRITIEMTGGNLYQGEYKGEELEWDFATETSRLGNFFGEIDWPIDKLNGLTVITGDLQGEENLSNLIGHCVR
ncbi:MAG: MmgE/PrpD family protein [Dehalococcoidia bacterium]|nr:MmgE/PrpD family protein [Dehalococcoidia bacterium]